MNMLKPDFILPCFPGFEMSEIDKRDVDHNVVSFSLVNGCIEIECEVVANILKEVAYVAPQSNPEYGHDVEYKRLEVCENDPVTVTNKGYADLADGQQLKLTEQQVQALNEQLEYLANEQFEEMAA